MSPRDPGTKNFWRTRSPWYRVSGRDYSDENRIVQEIMGFWPEPDPPLFKEAYKLWENYFALTDAYNRMVNDDRRLSTRNALQEWKRLQAEAERLGISKETLQNAKRSYERSSRHFDGTSRGTPRGH